MEFFETATTSQIVGIVFLVIATLFSFGSKSFCRMLGFSKEQFEGFMYWSKLIVLFTAVVGGILILGFVKF